MSPCGRNTSLFREVDLCSLFSFQHVNNITLFFTALEWRKGDVVIKTALVTIFKESFLISVLPESVITFHLVSLALVKVIFICG